MLGITISSFIPEIKFNLLPKRRIFLFMPWYIKLIINSIGFMSLFLSLIYTVDICIKSSMNDAIAIFWLKDHPEIAGTIKGIVIDLAKIFFSAIASAYGSVRNYSKFLMFFFVTIVGIILSILATNGSFHNNEDVSKSLAIKNSIQYINAQKEYERISNELEAETQLKNELNATLPHTSFKKKTRIDIAAANRSIADLERKLKAAKLAMDNVSQYSISTQESSYKGIKKTLAIIGIHVSVEFISNQIIFWTSLLLDYIGIAAFHSTGFSFGIVAQEIENLKLPDPEKPVSKKENSNFETDTESNLETDTETKFGTIAGSTETKKNDVFIVHDRDGSSKEYSRKKRVSRSVSNLETDGRIKNYEQVRDFVIENYKQEWSITKLRKQCKIGFEKARSFYDQMILDGILEMEGDTAKVSKEYKLKKVM